MIDEALRLLRDRRTYLRILYLLLAFPLGTTYFIVIVTGLATGGGLAIIFVGLFILALTIQGWVLFARLERELTIRLLGASIRPMSIPAPAGQTIWQRLSGMLTSRVTWKSLAYLLVEFPFGIFSFSLTVTLIALSVGLAIVPAAYLVALAFPNDVTVQLPPGFHLSGPPFGAPFLLALLLGVMGVGLGVVTIGALSGLGWLWARFAETMLGVSETEMQLAAARADARQQQARAEQADQSRRELIVNASHELRTPVASISAHVESLLKPGREMDEETRRYLTVVAKEAERLGSLVDDVLSLARADADELHLDVRPVDVPELIDQVCQTLAPLARQERNLSLVHSSAPGLPRAMADRDRLAQVLTNLIRNAVNNTADGGIISVEAAQAGERVVISVSDTGIGIPPQDISRVFQRFYRADQSRARDSGGSGLGLAIVSDLLIAMGGTITAESTPGRGSIFRASLQREAA